MDFHRVTASCSQSGKLSSGVQIGGQRRRLTCGLEGGSDRFSAVRHELHEDGADREGSVGGEDVGHEVTEAGGVEDDGLTNMELEDGANSLRDTGPMVDRERETALHSVDRNHA